MLTMKGWINLHKGRWRYWIVHRRTAEGACLTLSRWSDGLWRVHYMDTGEDHDFTHVDHGSVDPYISAVDAAEAGIAWYQVQKELGLLQTDFP